jgi:hypothetical protein
VLARLPFAAVWAVDYEFSTDQTFRPVPICLVAKELRSGQTILARTFAAQVEALKRYRTGGEQKVTVEHVTVNAGGQAIVGSVTHGGSLRNQAASS